MDTINIMKQALDKAIEERDHASYLSESGANAGIRKMNSNKADWLSWVIYLAEKGLEDEKRMAEPAEEEDQDGGWIPSCEECLVSTELKKLITAKDEVIEDLNSRLNSLQLSYDCELEYRKALAAQAKIDHFTEVIKIAHERSWLDHNVLVCPVEYLDRSLLELIKE